MVVCRHMQKLSVGECLRFGWDTFKKRPLIFVGAFVLTLVISGVSSAILDPGEGAPITTATILLGIVSGLIGLFVELGVLTFSIRAHDAVEKATMHDLWNPQAFVRYLIGQIVVGIIVVIGIILLIVPGVIAALGLMFTPYLVVDKGMHPIAALKESWRFTKGHKLQLFVLVLAIVGINILGLLALVVGLLVSVPVSMLAIAHAYRALSGNAASVSPHPIA